MRTYPTSISQLALALAGGTLCFAGSLQAQNSMSADRGDAPRAPQNAVSSSKTTTAAPAGESMKKEAKTSSKKSAGGNNGMSSQDSTFVVDATKGGMAEVAMSKMAKAEGKSAAVKEVGSQMVTDHTKANNELKAVLKKKGFAPPQVKMDEMKKMSGESFDKEYLAQMVTDHEKTIKEFQTEVKSGQDADLKAFAEKTLPTLREHLAMVRSAQKKMKG